MIIGVLPAFVVTGLFSLENGCTGAEPCGMFHVNLHEDRMYFQCSNFSLDASSNITITTPVDFKVELLSLVARSRKI